MMMRVETAPMEKEVAPAPREAAAGSREVALAGGHDGVVAAGWLGHDLLSHPANAGVRTLALRRAQQSYGNRFVQRMVSVAGASPMPARVVQRQCACGGTCATCRAGESDLAAATPGGATPGLPGDDEHRPIPPGADDSARPGPRADIDLFPPGGEPLDRQTRGFMESRLGADLGDVRVHTGSPAARAASAIEAQAYTAGRDIYFGAGQYQPRTPDGRKLLAHELTHTIQQEDNPPAVQGKLRVSQPDDPGELEADRIADEVMRMPEDGPVYEQGSTPPATARREGVEGDEVEHPRRPGTAPEPAPAIVHEAASGIARQEDPDHPHVPAPPQGQADVKLEPLADWNPIVDTEDPATFWTPPGTTREQIALRLYGDEHHYGGFDIIGDKHVRMRNLDGVVADVATPMRAALDARLQKDVDVVVGILKQRRINDADEWRLLHFMTWWASHSDLTNASNRSYFDLFLDRLDTHRLTEWGVFSDTTRTASEWLLIEADEKEWDIYPLLGKRSTRGVPRSRHTGEEMPDQTREVGPITASKREAYYRDVVGTYEYRSGEDRFGLESEKHATAPIRVGELIVTETTANRAEIALRNSPRGGARVMIPGGDGKFYGYTIASPHFWDAGYVQPKEPAAERLQDYWWHYPGTIFIPGGTYQPEVAQGGEAERQQRTEILKRALAGGLEPLRGLDFDVLSMLTLDQRITVLGLAVGSNVPADTSLVVRVLYSTPAADFPQLEHRLSTNGMMAKMLDMYSPEGGQAMIGRIFTRKALESMQVPGETLENLPEFRVGFDADGFYHYGYPIMGTAPSRLIPAAEPLPGGQVGIGHERAAAGEQAGPITRAVTTIQPMIFRLGGPGFVGFAENLVRGTRQTLMVKDGPPQGPFLPTQLVRIRSLGPDQETRIVSALEAVGLLQLPSDEILTRLIATHMHGGMVLMATMGLARVFGPAMAGALAEGGGARAAGAALAEAAATTAGRAAIVNALVIGGMEAVEQNRAELAKTPDGRAFLEIYDVAMTIWIANDAARLIASGLVPRLIAAADRVMSLPGLLRDAILPIRAEAEAFRRAVARFATPAEALAAATNEGVTMAAGQAPGKLGFSAMLRITRGEVAAERLTERIAGTPAQAAGRRVLGRLEGAITSAEREAAAVSGESAEAAQARAAATGRAESAARARLAIAQRAEQLRPEAREAFLNAVDGVIATRPNAIASLTDLLTAAAQSRTPNVFVAEVQKLVGRPGLSNDALRVLGAKAARGADVLDLAWLNRTSISDEALDFLGRDQRTPWDLYRRVAADPTAGDLIRNFRSAARGAGAEMVAEAEAERLGTNVRRQVKMGSSELDYEITVAGRPHGFEIKGWTAKTWEEALDAAIQRLNRRGLTDAQREAVGKIDNMIRQLRDAQEATGRAPYLGFTDALPKDLEERLGRVLRSEQLGGTTFVPLSEAKIKEAAAGTIGEAVGIPRP